jgi:hypothetical protein
MRLKDENTSDWQVTRLVEGGMIIYIAIVELRLRSTQFDTGILQL